MSLVIPHANLRYLLELALAARPNEACGLIGLKQFTPEPNGDGPSPPAWRATTLFPGDNIADDPTGNYLLNPHDQYRYEREMKNRGERMALFHSHPKSGAAPSQTDLELVKAHGPNMVFVIIGCAPDEAEPAAVFEAEGDQVAVGAYMLLDEAQDLVALAVDVE